VRTFWIAAAGLLLTAATATAGLPDPSRTVVGFKGQGNACHYRFRTDGGLDRLTLCVSLRDAFDVPIHNCSTSATLVPTGGTIAFGTCCANPKGGISDADGVLEFEFFQLGGRGTLDVRVSVHCLGAIEVWSESIDFTTPDLDASGGQNVVIDLGIWAGCYAPASYCEWSDYNCDGTVDVIDLALWAGGIGLACGQTTCP
jgi:hypothetical protein